jgi:hypothetical protein
MDSSNEPTHELSCRVCDDAIAAEAAAAEAEHDEYPLYVAVAFTEAELYALSEFFNSDEGEMSDIFHTPIRKKLFVAAAKAGLYDEVL